MTNSIPISSPTTHFHHSHFLSFPLISSFNNKLYCSLSQINIYIYIIIINFLCSDTDLPNMKGYSFTCAVVFLMLLSTSTCCTARLSSTFYDRTCPDALSTIRTSIRRAISKERRMAASLIRLHFHDCFVQVGNLNISVTV